MEHCCPELVEASYRHENTLPTLSDHHSTCVIALADVEPLRNWPAFQIKPKSEGSDRGGDLSVEVKGMCTIVAQS